MAASAARIDLRRPQKGSSAPWFPSPTPLTVDRLLDHAQSVWPDGRAPPIIFPKRYTDRDLAFGVQPIAERPTRFGGYYQLHRGTRSRPGETSCQTQLAVPVLAAHPWRLLGVPKGTTPY